MTPLPPQGRRDPFAWMLFIASAAASAVLLRVGWHEPVVGAALLGGSVALFASRWVSRQRLRRLLISGDVDSIIAYWAPSLERIPYPETMAPLMTATAFAANGRVLRARAALAAADRGPAWEAAVEHRLFLSTLLSTFEGDREAALESAGRLQRLPLPVAGLFVRDRIRLLRAAILAFARAFAHQGEPGDSDVLERASRSSPLVFWAMRYAGAVLAIDRGESQLVPLLLANAPNWPNESTLRAFHDEIQAHIGVQNPSE